MRRRHLPLILATTVVLVIAAIGSFMLRAKPCVTDTGQEAPRGYVAYKIQAKDAAPGPGRIGMGSTGTIKDVGQTACVTPGMRERLLSEQ